MRRAYSEAVILVVLFILFVVLGEVTLLEDSEWAGADKSAGLDAAEADEETFDAVGSVEGDVVLVQAEHAHDVRGVRSELTKVGHLVISRQVVGVGLVDSDGDAVGTGAANAGGNGGGFELAIIGKFLVEFNDTLLGAISVLDDALAEVPGITFIEETLELSTIGLGGEFSELVLDCLALSEAEDGSESDLAERVHFVAES